MTKCDDNNCPTHGSLNIRKRTLTGTVASAGMRKTVNVKRRFRVLLSKYQRFASRYSSIKAHNPECIGAEVGDEVTIAECKPLSKSKHYVVISKNKKENASSSN